MKILKRKKANPQDAVNRKLMEKIKELEETIIFQERLRLRNSGEFREEIAKLKDDRDTIFDVLKSPVTLFFGSNL